MSNPSSKVIITCAVTGSAHVPSMSEYLPIHAELAIKLAVQRRQQELAHVFGGHAQRTIWRRD